ncbi:glycosyltransferase [Peristeroidobacter agariperforans]|uniref:glycosyltransferase n=1 Tax=Peristeroidobacter agariperforans TaxID=268404 RepID=UPI00101E10F3|nr:glycosyltransferase [Peristeroidobacter agariperforans]
MTSANHPEAPRSPRVSVITPTYNREKFLGLAIQTVLGQSYADLEHIVIDDGSTDNTSSVIDRFKADSRLCFAQQKNSGQAVARNVGLRMARGEFICFLDSDNLWKLDKLARQIQLMDANPNVDIVYGDLDTIDEDGNVDPNAPQMKRHSGRITKQLLLDNFVSFNTAMVRRRCFDEMGGLNEAVRAGDDYDLWLRFSARYEFLYVPEIFAQYRVMRDQISSDKEKRFASNKATIERFFAANPGLISADQQRYVWSRFYVRRGRQRASVGRRKEGLADILTAIKLKPGSRVSWRALVRVGLLGG